MAKLEQSRYQLPPLEACPHTTFVSEEDGILVLVSNKKKDTSKANHTGYFGNAQLLAVYRAHILDGTILSSPYILYHPCIALFVIVQATQQRLSLLSMIDDYVSKKEEEEETIDPKSTTKTDLID